MYTVSYVTVSLAFNTVQLLSFGACFFDFVEDRIHWIDWIATTKDILILNESSIKLCLI